MKKTVKHFILSILIQAYGFAYCQEFDTSFNGTGVVSSILNPIDGSIAYSVQQCSDGGLVSVGMSKNLVTHRPEFALTKHHANGTEDSTFGVNGVVKTKIDVGDDVAYASLIQPDGKIVAVGYSMNDWDYLMFALVRYNANGSIDSTFGNTGIVTTYFQFQDAVGRTAILQADGKILMGGYLCSSTDCDMLLVRYLPNGGIDSSFGDNGVVITDFAGYKEGMYSIDIDPNGKIIVGGLSAVGTLTSCAIARYNSTGVADSTFGTNGRMTYRIKTGNGVVMKLKVLPSGKILAAGQARDGLLHDLQDMVVFRVNDNGTMDSTFGVNGVCILDYYGNGDDLYSMDIQSDSRIVLLGTTTVARDTVIALLYRLNVNGSIDTGFGVQGAFLMDLHDITGFASSFPYALTIQHDGKLVLAGVGKIRIPSNPVSNFLVMRIRTEEWNGLAEFKTIQAVTLFPNPTNAYINISYPNYSANTHLQITTTDGRVVIEQSAAMQSKWQVDVSNLAKGLYFAVLETEQGRVVRRFVRE